MIARHAPGSRVNLKVLRNGREQSFGITLAAINDEKKKGESSDEIGSSQSPGSHKLGIQVEDAPGGGALVRARRFRVPCGGPARPRRRHPRSESHPDRARGGAPPRMTASRKGEPLLLRVRHEDRIRFVAIKL